MINGNEILFPHTIGGNKLSSREYGINNINGGFTPIANYNIIRNSFMGGNVDKLGLVKELGFYVCPHFMDMKKIVGFYIHDPSMITELGKAMLQEHYPTYKITYMQVTTIPTKIMSHEDMEKKKVLIEQAIKFNVPPQVIQTSNVEELDGMLSAMASGKSGIKAQVNASGVIEASTDPVVVVCKNPVKR